MFSWNEIIQKYIIKHFNPIKKVTQPLKQHFGIEYFTYHRIDNAGNYTVLLDRPEWAEHYVNEKFYLMDPYMRHANVYRSGICLVDSQGTEGYKRKVMKYGKKVLDVDLGIVLIEKKEDGVEFFGFSGSRKTSCLEKLYLNDSQLLVSFAHHFKEEFKLTLRKMKDDANSLITLKGKDFLSDHPIAPDITPSTRASFLADLGMQIDIQKAVKLSLRERQCLKLYTKNKSAKEIGLHLDLSPRTIEFYLENIKNKLFLNSKQEVLEWARNFQNLKVIP